MSDIPVSYLTPEECSTAASQTIPLIETGFENDPFINGLLPFLKKNSQTLSMSMAVSNASEFTALIDAADTAFDEAFVLFRKFTEATVGLMTKPERAKAAQTINYIIEKHGRDLHRSGKVEQIGKTNSLINELQTEENQKSLNTADLTELFGHVITKHNEFVSLYNNRASAEKSRNTLPAPGEAKKLVAENLQDLYSHFKCTSKYVETYKDTAHHLEEIFSRIIPAARARRSRLHNEKIQKTKQIEKNVSENSSEIK